jgi:TetR/AcrR family transcriptional regulator, transcriptional repressor for nem operon
VAISLKNNSRPPRTAAPTAAATAILKVAEQLAQTRGYNGFSYADIAAQLGVTKASLHYHFASKAELGRALIERYRVLFGVALDAIDQQTKEPQKKLKQYVGLYNSVLSNERMCLCGMLAAEYETLPSPMQQGLTLFFDANERWLTAVLEDGLRAGTFLFREPANERARVVLGALEGAMLVARSYGNPRRFQMAAAYVLADLAASGRSKQRRTSGTAAARRPRRS